MEHRRFLAHPEAHRPFAGRGLLDAIGGAGTVAVMIDALYDRIEGDPDLRPLFGRDLTGEREAQKRFFCEWLGGEALYSSSAWLPLKHRHDLLPITRERAGKWLEHFRTALDLAIPDVIARGKIATRAAALAAALVNEGATASALRAHPHGTCLRYRPAVAALDLARRGDAAALARLCDEAPDVLASAPHAANLMQLAALRGARDVVELLIARGVSPNLPAPIQPLIFVTPLCAARVGRRREVEGLLLERGAKEDAFTHAYLGELDRLRDSLEAGPAVACTSDPATDALAITPVHHAVANDQLEALRMLFTHAPAGRAPHRALQIAVGRQNLAVVQLLLERGADATAIGAGRWVLHPELATLLASSGARVDRSGDWIQISCTGNQGRRDDPALVAALLAHGARVDDRRLTCQQTDGGRGTALHYAARAGFLKTIALLLERGADPEARDDNGRSPLDWLERAAKSVDRAAVRRLLGRRHRERGGGG